MNAAQCGVCWDLVRSRYASEKKVCACGALSVDGGEGAYRLICRADVPYLEIRDDTTYWQVHHWEIPLDYT